jgi:quercetin dioxygenase-like cupin family protein
MFNAKKDPAYKLVRDGVRLRTVAHGEKTHLTEVVLAKGSVIPAHAHPHEQTGYLVSGRVLFGIGPETFETRPGDGWNIGGGVPHGVEALEDSVIIEVFAPPREDYLA